MRRLATGARVEPDTSKEVRVEEGERMELDTRGDAMVDILARTG